VFIHNPHVWRVLMPDRPVIIEIMFGIERPEVEALRDVDDAGLVDAMRDAC
jgi:hypothetical protein